MEQEIPFKIFPLPRISSSHVSAVKPQAVVENTSCYQNLKSSRGSENKRYMSSNSDCISLKVLPIAVNEEENPESVNQLYSKLHREVEKIKKWKSNVEFEIQEREIKVQEKRNIIGAQKKIIKDLQIENGKLRLHLEDVIHENEDVIKQSNATRYLCNILKDTCEGAAEKANMYENEIDETRHFYSDLNNNIERMIMAFEELRMQAENSRQELYNQIKQDNEKRQDMQMEQTLELAKCKNQILELTKDRENSEDKISDLKFQLNESCNRIQELNEISDDCQTELMRHKQKVNEIVPQLEAANLDLQNSKNALKSSEDELQAAQTLLSEATKEKHLIVIELEDTTSRHVLQVSELQSKVESLKQNVFTEQRRLTEREDELVALKLEVTSKSSDFEELRKTNENHKKEIEKLKYELEEYTKVQKELEKVIVEEKSENTILKNKEQDLLISQINIQEQYHISAKQNADLKKSICVLEEVQFQLKEKLKRKEEEIETLNIKINQSSVDVDLYAKQIEMLKSEVSEKDKMYTNLKKANENIVTEKEEISRKTEEGITHIQKDLKASKQQRDQAMKKVENLEKTNDRLRKENDYLEEQLKAKEKECSTQHEDKKKHFENEFSKKEKQQKTLENKLNTLKRQVENKNKVIEDLQQENKSLKKKMKEGCKHCSVFEAEVKELHAQIEIATVQHQKIVSNKQLEITDAKTKEENLIQEVEKLKSSSEEAYRMQRENDIKCQHKIVEMMALMEKHKHQYDKLLEEKDAELGGLRAKEQDVAATRVLLEKMNLKSSVQHKEVQTVFMDTPKQASKIESKQNLSSFSIKTPVKERGRMSDNKDAFPWTTSKSSKSVIPKTFSVKTPPKYENIITHLQDSVKKKRKVALEFDFHSDSSDPTDILRISGNESILRSPYPLSHLTPDNYSTNSKKILTEAYLKSPGSVLKTSTIKRMREVGWTAISKADRRRKMKAAEKIFS
ncbi:synaptonemal complex protein 1 isoform 2-T4 [Anomaloglossus baeobatrachus]|uniref:synaptonemal complex protein 1 isoform X2 n=1 Tax=Anomaloglossus baeobatrachus TaxID=238106 RepID=UPI003F4FF0A4